MGHRFRTMRRALLALLCSHRLNAHNSGRQRTGGEPTLVHHCGTSTRCLCRAPLREMARIAAAVVASPQRRAAERVTWARRAAASSSRSTEETLGRSPPALSAGPIGAIEVARQIHIVTLGRRVDIRGNVGMATGWENMTWAHVEFWTRRPRNIANLVHPTNPDLVYVAGSPRLRAEGRACIYRSRDATSCNASTSQRFEGGVELVGIRHPTFVAGFGSRK